MQLGCSNLGTLYENGLGEKKIQKKRSKFTKIAATAAASRLATTLATLIERVRSSSKTTT